MLFVYAGRVIACVAIILGLMRIVMGLFVSTEFDGHSNVVARYLGSVESTGDAIDRGLLTMVVSVVIGLLTPVANNRNFPAVAEFSQTRED